MNKLKSFLFFKPLEAIFFWKCKLPIELSILKELCSTFVKSLGNRSNFGHISNVYILSFCFSNIIFFSIFNLFNFVIFSWNNENYKWNIFSRKNNFSAVSTAPWALASLLSFSVVRHSCRFTLFHSFSCSFLILLIFVTEAHV